MASILNVRRDLFLGKGRTNDAGTFYQLVTGQMITNCGTRAGSSKESISKEQPVWMAKAVADRARKPLVSSVQYAGGTSTGSLRITPGKSPR